MPMNRQ